MLTYRVIVTGIKLSDGTSFKLETTCEVASAKEVLEVLADYDWADARTMVVNIWPQE